MNKIILGFLLMLALVFPTGVFADAYSQGGTDYSVSIDKKIRPINDSNFYDNIGRDQKIFVAGDVMDFNILVENTGKDILNNLVVKDYYPVVNQIILAPSEIDRINRQITWTIDTLSAGETRNFTIRAKVATSSSLAQTNVATVRNNNVYDRDTATFYVGGKNSPNTGSNDLLIGSAVALGIALSALALRKLARGY
ncbi:MAG: hypothetical protein WC784_00740 [Candidatus Shapirobacteria bacterium]|jgi:hypothetical protein